MTLYIVLGIIIVSLILFYISCLIAHNAVSKCIFPSRGDASISIKYPSPMQYRNLTIKKDYFLNNKKARLSIIEYKSKNIEPKGLVLVSHGIGGGHFYLLPLINYLCEKGLLVLAYDQYASGMSEGKRIESMTQGAIDIKFAVKYVESHYNLPFYLLGHSWGGFSVSQALRFSNNISKCLIIAGPNSEADMVQGKMRKFVSFFVRICGFTKFGKYSFYTMYQVLKKTTAKVLYLQGENDLVVNPKYSGYLFKNKLANRLNIDVQMLPKKGHSPQITYESQLAQSKMMSQFGLLGNELVPLETYIDFEKNNIPDMDVYNLIVDFFVN